MTTDASPAALPPSRPAREAVLAWLAVLATLAIFKFGIAPVLPWGGSITGALAVALFLWVPGYVNRRAGRELEDDGLRFDRWREDLVFALVVMAIVFPTFVVGFRVFLHAADHWLPTELARVLTPYGASGRFSWRLPDQLFDRVAGNVAVGLGEEYFYRGYMLRRFSERWPPRLRFLGAPVGLALVLQSALFAAGHLLSPQPFRLGTFFPGLLFGWMAARSGRVVAPALVHAASNLLIATLEASAFGR
jgi:uncharacterized protein